MEVHVSAVQCLVGSEKSFESAKKLIDGGIEAGVELFLLPEYFSYTPSNFNMERSEETIEFIKKVSREHDCIVAGNVLIKTDEGYMNSLHIFDSGDLVGIQEKIHPTSSEKELGIIAGKEAKVFDVRGFRLGALICADILYPEICRVMALKNAEIILNPVVSFKKNSLPAKELRHCLYFTRSFDNAYAIVKAGGTGITFLGSETAGRSLISTPFGIEAIYSNEDSEELVSSKIDISMLRDYRKINYSISDRNVLAYRDLLS
ncbi:putative amidohydrolase [Archaeoglobus sulfaticallidus PM70-1]|uniref:Putative amidohydrolase n=1 Tax=Archaeoglobus sulfaticallidus PM70-1 TaxID=387631 RepID=N0BEI6_9EURY|nr:carbon-nitrogen hydrolase family protein [Archaeoglobus sulfaticallidus]AGK61428.1 putative amidohydrolase [Archaeoglobus sulfaticallidus PM70-1]